MQKEIMSQHEKKYDFYKKERKKSRNKLLGISGFYAAVAIAVSGFSTAFTGLPFWAISVPFYVLVGVSASIVREESGNYHLNKKYERENKQTLDRMKEQEKNKIPKSEKDHNKNNIKVKNKVNNNKKLNKKSR